MTTATRTNPLSYLTGQLNELKAKGTHFKLRVLEDEQAPVCTFDGKKVINLASKITSASPRIPSCARPPSKPRVNMESGPARCAPSPAL